MRGEEIKKVKEAIRQRIWRLMEEKDIADFPRPVYGRIPNFKGSDVACERLCELEVFRMAEVVKVNPDSPQRRAREICLERGKLLVVPTPRIRRGFILLDPSRIPESAYREASTIRGAMMWGQIVKPWDLPRIDLIIIGSVAVNYEGIRLGKSEGYAEIEWGILYECGKVDEDTPVATTVHDVQVLSERIPFEVYDLPVDLIATPTRTIWTRRAKEKPRGIYWDLLSREKIESIPLLRELAEIKGKRLRGS